MNKNKIVIGILSVFLLSPSIIFGYTIPEIPKVTPPSSATSQRLCWDSKTRTEYPCAPGTPYMTDIIGNQPSGAPLITTQKITFARFKEVIGGAFGQLTKIAEGLSNWVKHIFVK